MNVTLLEQVGQKGDIGITIAFLEARNGRARRDALCLEASHNVHFIFTLEVMPTL